MKFILKCSWGRMSRMLMPLGRIGLLAFFCLGLSGPTTYALTNEDCLMCHANMEPRLDASVFSQSAHGGLNCQDCHENIQDVPHQTQIQSVRCGNCHTQEFAEYQLGVHGKALANGTKDVPSCASCHGTHDIFPKSDVRSKVNPLNLPGVCSGCHASQEITRRHPLPSPEFIESYQKSVHGQGVLKSGLVVAAVCSDCHGGHRILPASDPASLVNPKNIPKTCSKCHAGIFRDFTRSAHGEAWRAGKSYGPVCTTCHTAHSISSPRTAAFHGGIAEECGGCHVDRTPSYRDTFHGQATSLGLIRAATCPDCHTAHLNLPKENPHSSINPKNLPGTCGRCHGQVSKGFIQYDPHPDPKDKSKNAVVFYTYTFMNWLLLGVFAFFGLHSALWIQRSLVASVRGEFPRLDKEGPWVRRFSQTNRMTHLVIVVSFLLLAATGLPLKFHYTPWAKVVEAIFGGIEVTRYLHKLFAVVTFGYAITHVSYLVYRIYKKGELNLLYGPFSLTPRPKDALDLLANLRWFLYMGPRPKLGRWTYWEKFDYFAVFWGIPIIGGSGLMLWFPGFFTKFLPGWVLNVAMIVHSEEALMAIGFIFLFHFFHTHLRPESFPLDTVIFTGSMPLERLKEERPEEYELLVKKGELERLIVPAPSNSLLRASRIFGFVALTVGLCLIWAILITVILHMLAL